MLEKTEILGLMRGWYPRLFKVDPCLRCGVLPMTEDARFCTRCGVELTTSVYYAIQPVPGQIHLTHRAENRFQKSTTRSLRPLPGYKAVFRLYRVRWIGPPSSLAGNSPHLTDIPSMFWRIQYGRSLEMEDNNSSAVRYLVVNRAEIMSEGCSACGRGFAADPPGARALAVTVGPDDGTYTFCAGCGESIMEHLQADAVRQNFAWDFTVPLRGKPLKNGSH
jgi:hypothetical protein